MTLVISASTTGRITPTASTTACTIANNVLQMLQDFPQHDTHSNAPSSSGTSLTVTTDATTRYEQGDEIEWREDCSFERAIITAVTSTTLTIVRGVRGSTAASHLANARFVKNPDYYGWAANKAVSDSLTMDLWPELYAVYQATFTPANPYNKYFEAAADAEKILRVYQLSDDTPTQMLDAPQFSQVLFSDTTISATSRYFTVPTLRDANNTMYAQYAIIPAIGDLTAGMARIVEHGVAWRLLGYQSSTGGLSNRVPQDTATASPGGLIRDAGWHYRQQQLLIKREAARQENISPRPRIWVGRPHQYS